MGASKKELRHPRLARPARRTGTSRGFRPACGALWVLPLCLGWGLPARAPAQPIVRVQAGSRLALHVRQASSSETTLRGLLTDDLGQPLVGAQVRLQISEHAGDLPLIDRKARTDPRGSFLVPLPLQRRAYDVKLRYEGDARHTPASVERRLDLAREPVDIRPTLDSETLDLTTPEHTIRVLVTSRSGPSGLVLTIHDEEGERVASAVTPEDGQLTLRIQSARLAPPGKGELVFRTGGDQRRQAAETRITIVRRGAPGLVLRSRSDQVDPGGSLTVEGRLTVAGKGLSARAVTLTSQGQHIATVSTAEDGTFERRLQVPAEPLTQLLITAHYRADRAWLSSAAAPPVRVKVRSLRAMPHPAWLVLLSGCALGLAWLAIRRGAPRASALADPPYARGAGVHVPAARSLGNSRHTRVSGIVVQASRGEPVKQAMLRFSQPERAAFEIRPDSSGRFRSPALRSGVWMLTATAPGFVPAGSTLTLPHRGELHAVTIALDSLRDRAVGEYRRVARRIHRSGEAWRMHTPTETLQVARTRGLATPELVQLTKLIEVACYGRTPPTNEVVERIADHARRAAPPEAQGE